jgi:hypothetical protein
MPRRDADTLPEWEDGTVAVLSTGGGAPHAIPVSTGVRAGPRRVVFALARRRGSLQRLRAEPAVALTLMAAGDVAVTAFGRATVLAERLSISDRVAAVVLDVERIQDHMAPGFQITGGVRWHWTDERARIRDAEIRAALRALAP